MSSLSQRLRKAKAKPKAKGKAKAKPPVSDEDKLQRELTTSLTKLHSSLVSELKATRLALTTARSRADAEPWLRELTEKVALSLGALEAESANLTSRLGTTLCAATVEGFKS